MLVDVSSERSCQISAVGEDDISSLYQFTISSANTQPTDRGERTYLNFEIVAVRLPPLSMSKNMQSSASWCRMQIFAGAVLT